MRTFILGAARGYDLAKLRPFVLSLIATDFQDRGGQAVIFADSMSAEDATALEYLGLRVIPVDLGPGPGNIVNILRYRLYRDFLATAGPCLAMLTDVRDVVFQADPFETLPSRGLHCFLEDGRMRVSTCPWTARWVESRHGTTALAAIADRPLSCSGITMGDSGAMLRYLDSLLPLLTPLAPELPGYDQGCHNVLVHSGALPDLTLHPTESGPVMTMGYMDNCSPDPDCLVRNPSGGVPAVIHQYDRIPALRNFFWGRYTI